MSKQILEHKAFDDINDFLSNDRNAILIEDFKGNRFFYTKPETQNKKYHLWFKSTIEQKYKSVFLMFNSLYQQGYEGFSITLKKTNGSSKKVVGKIKIELDTMLRKSGESFDAPNSLYGASNHSDNQINTQHQMKNDSIHELGALGYASKQAGLGFNELVDLQVKAKSYDKLYKENEANLKRIAELDIKNQSLEAQVNTSERAKSLAVKEAELSQKGFTETEGFKELIKAVPDALGIILQSKSGNTPTGLGTTNENVSQAKKEVIDFIKSKEVTDQDAQIFYSSVIYHISKTEGFQERLKDLITEYTNA